MLSLASLVLCCGAAVALANSFRWLALASWLIGRFLDGLDGAVARHRGVQSDLGGYLDMMGDTLGYAAVPIGVAFANSNARIWMWCAVLLASFYVNTMSWTYLSALFEKRAVGPRSSATAIVMPRGVIEGAETIVFFSCFIVWWRSAHWWFAAMTTLVFLTVIQRLIWGQRHL